MFINRSFSYLRPHFNSQIFESIQSFSSSSANWKFKVRPINVFEPDPKSEEEIYLEGFKSRKGPSGAAVAVAPKDFTIKDILTIDGLKTLYEKVKTRLVLWDQRYIDLRVDILGYDLAAAHFVVYRGGKILFTKSDEWVQKDKDVECNLPTNYDETYIVKGVDISGTKIIYDGLENLENLSECKIFRASRAPYIDDWAVDRICAQFIDNLEELDISHCPLVTWNGLQSLAKLKSLKKLNVSGLTVTKNIQLVCMLLQDLFPDLEVEGVPSDSVKSSKAMM